ncbi:hypothetical protein [Chamaesiphon polymorphus]|uniref:Uncharacterized protein n=1 Tax=Chamaesiphon polymorphus CCALA 037 TaxID=2107692 RepID=A0A2T1F9F8_9CYAN|nr:hypothetical protein [Chamaesiphon polymorphus]PSB41631.1 hypothetical protein C7B77_27270 [Chamaesiphon polymorphus CCALA 037]
MNLSKICLSAIALLSWSAANGTSAFALPPSDIVQYQSPQQEVLTINLHSGLGTNISFNAVNETVETMFLDNQSYVSLTTDGCLSKSETQPCAPGSAPTLVHLSLIDDIELPGVVRVNKRAGRKSLLTVVTNDARRQKKTYVFTLKLFGKNDPQRHVALIQIVPTAPKPLAKPTPSTIVKVATVVPPKSKTKRQSPTISAPYTPVATATNTPFIPVNLRVTNSQSIDYLKTGFRLAIMRGDYKFNNPQYERINKFILALNGGTVKLESAPAYGLNLNLVANLVSLGTPLQ